MHRIVSRARVPTACAFTARCSVNARRVIPYTTYIPAAKARRTQTFTSAKLTKMLSPVDLTQELGSEESDEDLKLAIAMSLSQQDNSNNSASPEPTTILQPAKAGGIMGLDRKQMEAERLARQAQLKRKRGDEGKSASISPPPLSRRTRTTSPPSSSSPRKKAIAETKHTSVTSGPAPPKATLRYPDGIIKRTWISSHPRTDRDITFSELIDAPNLKSAVLSSFIWDFDWLFQQVRTKETKFVLVMHGELYLSPPSLPLISEGMYLFLSYMNISYSHFSLSHHIAFQSTKTQLTHPLLLPFLPALTPSNYHSHLPSTHTNTTQPNPPLTSPSCNPTSPASPTSDSPSPLFLTAAACTANCNSSSTKTTAASSSRPQISPLPTGVNAAGWRIWCLLLTYLCCLPVSRTTRI